MTSIAFSELEGVAEASQEAPSEAKDSTEELGRTLSATDPVNTAVVDSFRPTNRTLALSTFSLSNSNPLFHVRSPAKPGAPDGATNGCAAKGVPCEIAASPGIVAALPCVMGWSRDARVTGGGDSGGAGRERSEETHLVGKEVPVKDVGMKNDCARCTSGVDILFGDGGREGERPGSPGACVRWGSVWIDSRVGCRDFRS